MMMHHAPFPRAATPATAVAAVVCTLGVCGCHLDRQGMVMVTDTAYRAKLVATHGDGLDMPDGILWREGKLILADEGAGALRVWGSSGGITTLCDSTAGIHEPEDLVADREGNVFFTDDDAGGVWEIDPRGRVSLLAGRDKGLPSTEGIALAAPRVFMLEPGQPCILRGAFRLPVLHRHIVPPVAGAPGTEQLRTQLKDRLQAGEPMPTGVVPVTLVMTGTETIGPEAWRLIVPTYDRLDATAERPVATGTFAIDLRTFPGFDRHPQTWHVYAFSDRAMAGPTLVGLTTPSRVR